MYVRRIHLENIKTFRDFVWELEPDEDPAGWHVLLGDNGAGKTTFVRAVSYVLIGTPESFQLRQNNMRDWVNSREKNANIILKIELDDAVDLCNPKREFRQIKNFSLSQRVVDNHFLSQTGLTHENQKKPISVSLDYSTIISGWFSASYGPYRRFTGGSQEYEPLYEGARRLSRHLSAFGEDVALTETLDWLMSLRFKELENDARSEQLLNKIFEFVNQTDFLPNNVYMSYVTSEGVTFTDAAGHHIEINALSDGYRSILSMTLELIRQMVACYETPDIFDETGTVVTYPGVVLIDEIDVHLHPTWQRKIGDWFTKHFPRIQFIVTTHSAFVCQSATNGSIWRLPNPGDSDDKGERITGSALNRLLYGNLLEAYSSGAFGMEVNRSDDAQAMLDELADLNVKAMFEPLNDAEQARREQLQGTFNTTPQITKNGDSAP